MRRTLLLSLVALTFMGGMAFADRGRGRDRGATVVRQHNRDQRRFHQPAPVRVDTRVSRRAIDRRPVYVDRGRFVFHNGVTRGYTRPVIRERYFDYRVRPRLVVETYDPMPGYMWVAGQWQWNGREWLWTSGYYAPDPSYTFYDDGYYFDGRAYYRW
jgi:hypothetical protein